MILLSWPDADGSQVFTMHDGDSQIGRLVICSRELTYGRTSAVRYAEIISLTVVAERRREGVGRQLVERALRWAEENGYERVAVESTARSDKPGPPFYEALGFVARSIIWDVAP